MLGLCSLLVLVAAAPASALTRTQATRSALAALGSRDGSDPVVVFGLRKSLRVGTRISEAGSGRGVARVRGERAFFYFENAHPSRLTSHGGRVALVGVKSGKVRIAKTRGVPLVDGARPVFLTSSRLYRAPTYRVFQRVDAPASSSSPDQNPFTSPTLVPAGGSTPVANDQTVTVKQNAPKHITLTASDADGDPLTFAITKNPNFGTLSGQPPNVVYTPFPGQLGPDHFFFNASDGDHVSKDGKVTIAVVPRGIPSTVTASAGCTAYTERTPAVVVDDQIAVADPDDVVLDSAKVRIASNFQDGDDLLFTDQNGITGNYDDASGVLSLTGDSSVANYQAALRSVRYRNLGSRSPAPSKDVAFTVNDAGGDSAPAVKQVCIAAGDGVNDPPIGETSEGALSYVENDGPVPLDAGFVVGDPDSANLTGAKVEFIPLVSQPVDPDGNPDGPPQTTNTFAPAEDALAFANQNGISGSYDGTTGVLTLSGSASVENYEAAIRSVTYENSSENPSDAQRRVRFKVTDSSGATSTPSTRDIFVTPVNDAPVVKTSGGSSSYTGFDPPVAVDPGVTPSDVDDTNLEGARVRITGGFESGDTLGFTAQGGIAGSYDGTTGELTLTGTASVAAYQTALRSVTYSHTGGNPAGSRTVAFTVNDGDLDSDPATRTLQLNDKPILDTTDAALSYTENAGPVAVDSGITATDADSPTLTSATVRISSNFAAGEDALAFTNQNGISGSYDGTTGTLTLSGTASVAAYQAALRSVTYANSSDNPSTATRTVTFRADDGAAANHLSDPATRDVQVTAVNDAPVVTTSAGSTAYTEGDPATAVDSGVTVADVDDSSIESARVRVSSGYQAGDQLAFADQNGISGTYDGTTGTLTLSGTASVADYQAALRSVKYSHTADNPSSSKSVEFTVNDGDADSNAAVKSLTVTPVNDKPVLDTTDTALAYTAGSGAVAVDPGIVASDPDSTTLAGATVKITTNRSPTEDALAFTDQNGITGSYNQGNGTLTLSGTASVADYQAALRSVTYENTASRPSTDTRTVSFQVDDGAASDNLSDAATRDVQVSVPNAAPVVTTSNGSTSYTDGDTSGVAVDPALTVSDSDDANLASAQVRLSSGFESGDDLVFVDQNGISGVYDTGTGVLTLSGSATVADYQAALRSVVFRHAGTGASTPKTVEFTVNDGEADSNAAAKTIDVVYPQQ